MTKAAFILSAGFGTRFQPQTNFIPKPALPFFNLPQALYPTGLLKEIGVSDFHYNSHHLPSELDQALLPYFKRPSLFESEILESGGGIHNAKGSLAGNENFWVVNGDSFVTAANSNVLKEAYDFHIKTNSITTLIGIKKNDPKLNGLVENSEHILTHTEKGPKSLHFIGFYIFNKEIFNYMAAGKSHILKDILLGSNFKEKVSVFNAKEELTWFETGNELDFINCHKIEAKNLKTKQEASAVYKTHKIWGLDPSKMMEQFLCNKTWGFENSEKHNSDFLILPEDFSGEIKNLKNSVVCRNIHIPDDKVFDGQVLVDSTQWA